MTEYLLGAAIDLWFWEMESYVFVLNSIFMFCDSQYLVAGKEKLFMNDSYNC